MTNTFRQVGSSLGAAIIGSVLLTAIVADLQAAAGASPRIPPAAKPAIEETIRQHASGLAFGSGGLFDRLPPPARDEMARFRRIATTDGNRRALLYGAGFILLGLLVSTRLPLRAAQEQEMQGRGGTGDAKAP